MNRKVWLWTLIILLVVAIIGMFFFLGGKRKQSIQNKLVLKDQAETTSTNFSTSSFIDTHIHTIVSGMSLADVNKSLANYKVSKSVLMQPPVDLLMYQEPKELGIPEAVKSYPKQFYALYQGEAIRLLHEVVKKGNYTAQEEATFKTLAEDAARSGKYLGFGELALRHYSQPGLKGEQRKSRDITISGDHPWLFDLSDIAAKYNMVLDIHIEPDDSTLPGFEKLILHNNKTKIIFDHAGWYNTGKGTPDLFTSLMGKYPNLYASIKLRKPASSEQKAVAILPEKGKISQDWLAAFEKHSDRYVIGTDIKLGLGTEEGNIDEIYGATTKFLELLPDNLRQKISVENAQKLFSF